MCNKKLFMFTLITAAFFAAYPKNLLGMKRKADENNDRVPNKKRKTIKRKVKKPLPKNIFASETSSNDDENNSSFSQHLIVDFCSPISVNDIRDYLYIYSPFANEQDERKNGETILHKAVRSNNASCVRATFGCSKSLNPQIQNHQGYNPLHCALQKQKNGNIDFIDLGVIEAILQDPRVDIFARTHAEGEANRQDCFDIILRQTNMRKDTKNNRIILLVQYALQKDDGREKILNWRNVKGKTLIHCCAQELCTDSLKYIIDLKIINPDIIDSNGLTALQLMIVQYNIIDQKNINSYNKIIDFLTNINHLIMVYPDDTNPRDHFESYQLLCSNIKNTLTQINNYGSFKNKKLSPKANTNNYSCVLTKVRAMRYIVAQSNPNLKIQYDKLDNPNETLAYNIYGRRFDTEDYNN